MLGDSPGFICYGTIVGIREMLDGQEKTFLLYYISFPTIRGNMAHFIEDFEVVE